MSEITELEDGYRIRPDATTTDIATARAAISIAISLKRIADMMAKAEPMLDFGVMLFRQMEQEAMTQAIDNVFGKLDRASGKEPA